MSTKFPYIDIAVNMAESDGQSTTFLTEGAPAVQLPALAGIAAHFTSLTDGYIMWPAGEKRAFTYFVLDGFEGTPIFTATLLIDRDILISGRPILNLLNAIKGRALDGDTLSTETIDRLITEAGFSEEPLRSQFDPWGNPETGGVCCRTYTSPGELTNILGFPRQSAYDRYRGVVIVPATVVMVSGEELPQITSPIDKALMVVCPDDVTASAQSVNFSDHLKVTYTAEGFEPVSVMFEVGTTNRYVRINGPALIVNSARHAGIVFRRRVPYSVLSIGGTPIDTYTILINGRTASRTDEGFEVTNTDFEDGKIKITVSSTNFSTYTQSFTPEMLEESMPLAIVLEPESKEILIRLDFGDGRIIEDHLNIEKNTPEYCQLRAGRFHGFRAHRLMGSSPETYNIDVKPTYDANPSARARVEATLPFDEPAKETAPAARPQVETEEEPDTTQNIDNSQTQTAQPDGPVAPNFKKAPTAIWEEKKSEIKAPEFANATKGEGDEPKKFDIDYRKYGKYAVIAVIAIFAIWGLSKLFSGCGSSDSESLSAETPGDSVSIVDPATGEVTKTAADQAAAAPTEAETADITYLNENKIWKRESLQTERYKALFDAFAAGEIDDIVSNDYFAVKDRATNKEAIKAIDLMWNAKGTNQQKSHRKLMTKMAEKGSIDIHSLYEDVARRMPQKEEYNNTPRPSRS